MGVRLNKVIKEFNVGLQTVVDYLEKKGLSVKNDLNAKLSDEQYQVVRDEFGSDKRLRNEADMLITQRQTEKVKEKKTPPAGKVVEEIKTEIPDNIKPQFKPVGKINLDNVGKPAASIDQTDKVAQQAEPEEKNAPQKEEITRPVEEPKAKPVVATISEEKAPEKVEKAPIITEPEEKIPVKEPEPVVEKPIEKPIEKPQPAPAEKPVEKPVQKPVEKPQEKQAPKPEVKHEQKPQQKPQPKHEEKHAPQPAPKKVEPQPVKEKPAASNIGTVSNGVFHLNGTPTISGPKVLGSIDLSSINENTRPRKKTKEEKRKEREEKLRQQHATQGNASKKKRNRISGNKVDINTEAKKVSDQPRPDNQQRNNQRNNNNQNQKGKNRRQQQQQTSFNKPQVSDEDVAKEIKKTLARLTSKKNFSNSAKYRREKRDQVRAATEERINEENKESKVLKLTEFVTANELASMMNISPHRAARRRGGHGLYLERLATRHRALAL
jgi:translation initiation factor IF-2